MVKLLLVSLLLIGAIDKLRCASLYDEVPPNANPALDDFKQVNFGKISVNDHLMKQVYLHEPRLPGQKGKIREQWAFSDDKGRNITQVRLRLYKYAKGYEGQNYKIQPKSLRKKPTEDVYVEVFNIEGGVLAEVQIYGH